MDNRPEPDGITYDQWLYAVQGIKAAEQTSDRPPCPRCGSTHVRSQGPSWGCYDCGKQFVKNRHEKEEPDRTGRPLCPECGGPMNGNGTTWICKLCGKQIKKRAIKREVV